MAKPEGPKRKARVDNSLSAIIGERRLLTNLAYRMLGSAADAEDIVQETYIRWYAMSEEKQQEIDSPGAWLVKVASRICLDLLDSARVRRERYVGDWIPEPLPDRSSWSSSDSTDAAVDPADRVTLDESVSMAFLVVLESMTPAERVAFISTTFSSIPSPRSAGSSGAHRRHAGNSLRQPGDAFDRHEPLPRQRTSTPTSCAPSSSPAKTETSTP